jgi:APA family basic amino acid/polyamine antiporter
MAEVFLRKASGLVREVSGKDVVFFNTGGINAGIGLAFIFLLGPAFYPGANHNIALILTWAFCVIQTLMYLFFTVTMPRSGGEYLYISRSLHPSIGFAMSFSYTLMMLFYSAFAANQFSTMGLSSIFQSLSVKLGAPNLMNAAVFFESQLGSFIIGLAVLIGFMFVLIQRMKTLLRVQLITFIVAILGFVAIIIALLLGSRAGFMASFNGYASSFVQGGDPYNAIIESAKAQGYVYQQGISWSSTWNSMVWPFFALAFCAQSASFAGEIRKVGRSQFLGTTGAMTLAAALMLAVIALARKVVGWEFIGAINFLTEGRGPATPWFHFLAVLMTKNVVLWVLILLGWLAWTYYWVPVNMLYVTRVVFSWSFDRIAPAGLGKVSEKNHTPTNTVIVGTIICAVFLALIVFTPYFKTLQGIVTMTLTFVIMGISGFVFPFVKKDLFNRSPANYRVLGIPVMSILGLITAVFMAWMAYRLLVDAIVGARAWQSLVFVFGQIVLGFVLFFVAKAYRKRKDGIDVMMAYREIPSE